MSNQLASNNQILSTIQRQRRYRLTPWMRQLMNETALSPADLIYPIFVSDSLERSTDSGPLQRCSIDEAQDLARAAVQLGIPAVILFPHISAAVKDERGSHALASSNIIFAAIKAIKDSCPGLGVIADVALDPYTSHGHDGLIDTHGTLLNDATVEILIEQAQLLVAAGADAVAPSDMTDGRIAAIRAALNHSSHHYTPIFSYAAKYASSLYKPFRQCVGSQPALLGNKLNYQLAAGERQGALRKIAADVAEGADAIIVKPCASYLDIVWQAKEQFSLPVLAYQVSGEYAMLHYAAQAGALDYDAALLESLIAAKRAGATACITYGALAAAKLLNAAAS